MSPRRVQTWDQMNLGGRAVRFHSETIGEKAHQWECEQEYCDDCHTYEQENKS